MEIVKSDNPDYVFVAPGVLQNVNVSERAKYEASLKQSERLSKLESDMADIKYLLMKLTQGK
jgi:hypothetical protein